MRLDAAIAVLLNSRLRAGVATASLWACALLLSVLAFQVVSGWRVPAQDILQLLGGLPMAPTPAAVLPLKGLGWVFDHLSIDDGAIVPISVALIWMGVVVSYWGTHRVVDLACWRAAVEVGVRGSRGSAHHVLAAVAYLDRLDGQLLKFMGNSDHEVPLQERNVSIVWIA
jgi:hypothetical protein